MADTNLWVLVKVITKSDVPPALMLPGVNDFETTGKLGDTESRSTAVQVPAAQPSAVLVFETPAGAEIEAVLVIWVCAKAFCGASRDSTTPAVSANALTVGKTKRQQKNTRLQTLAIRDKEIPKRISYA